MSHEISTVEVVFRDLSDAFDELSAQNLSPRKVRTVFSNFLELSYRLTQMMYKEYPRKTGEKWQAKNFDRWNEVSEFLKELRPIDAHKHTVLIQVHERNYFGITEDSPECFVSEHTWSIGDQHANLPPEGVRAIVVDPKTGQAHQVPPRKTEYEFYLYPHTEEKEAELLQLGDRNIHSLSKKYFDTLKEYYQYYHERLTTR